jgi:hypothetical protein
MKLHEEALRLWHILNPVAAHNQNHPSAPQPFWTIDKTMGAFEPIEQEINGHAWEEAESLETLQSNNGIYLTLFKIKGFTNSIRGKIPHEFNYVEVWTATPQAMDPQDGGGDPVLFFGAPVTRNLELAFLEFLKENMAVTLTAAAEAIWEHEQDQAGEFPY